MVSCNPSPVIGSPVTYETRYYCLIRHGGYVLQLMLREEGIHPETVFVAECEQYCALVRILSSHLEA
jgi:hypothetical protein